MQLQAQHCTLLKVFFGAALFPVPQCQLSARPIFLLQDLLFAQLCQKSSTVSDGSGAAEAISPEPSSSNQPGAGQRGRLAARLQTWHRERGTAVDRAPSELIAGPAQGGPGTGSALGGDAGAWSCSSLPSAVQCTEAPLCRLPSWRSLHAPS